MLPLLLFYNVLFIFYFWFIGLWYIGFLPLAFIVFVFMNLGDAVDKEDKKVHSTFGFDVKQFIIDNLFFVSWGIILIGLYGFINFYGASEIYSLIWQQDKFVDDNIWKFWIVLGNLFLLIFSFIVNYKDGTKIFHFGLYFSILLFFIFLGLEFNSGTLLILASLIFPFILAIYSFLYFIIGQFRNIKFLKYIVFLFFNINVLFFLYNFLGYSQYIEIFLLQVYLFVWYIGLFIVQKIHKKLINKPKERQLDKLDIILADGKVNKPVKKKKTINHTFGEFFVGIPDYVKFLTSLLNVVLIFIQIYLFYLNIGSTENVWLYEGIYWLSIFMFVVNFFVLKMMNFSSMVQRIFIFFIVNFSIYLSIINILGDNIMYIVFIGIGWNIFNSILIFFSEKISRGILFREDFYFWIFANFCAMLANLYFIFKLDLDMKLKWFLIFIYGGIYMFISLYNFKYIDNMRKKITQ